MCHRFTLRSAPDALMRQLHIDFAHELPDELFSGAKDRYPLSQVVVVRSTAEHEREMTSMQWGLVPFWFDAAKQQSKPSSYVRKYSTYNATCEKAHQLPTYRAAFKSRRCLVPATRFFEPFGKGGNWFELQDEQPIVFAGLWDDWKQEDTAITSCTILTTAANTLVAENRTGRERMPVILATEEARRRWLDPDITERQPLESLFEPTAANAMKCYAATP